MRLLVVACLLLAADASLAAADAPPDPVGDPPPLLDAQPDPEDAPEPPPPPPPEEEPQLEPEAPAPPSEPPRRRALPDPDDEVPSVFASPFLGSLVGCSVAGALPAGGLLVSGLLGAGTCLCALSAGGPNPALLPFFFAALLAAVYVGCPSALAIGPCSTGGACVGGSIGSLLGERPILPAVLGASAGAVLALASLGLFAATPFLAAANAADPAAGAAGAALLLVPGLAVGLGVLSGPVAVLGVALSEMGIFGGGEPGEPAPTRRRRVREVRAWPAEGLRPAEAAMAF